jgi:histidine triad (HIT) family protein
MATVFTRIIEGDLPGRFVHRDARCVAFLSINPLRPGHVLVVPRVEVDHWVDLQIEEWQHLTQVAQRLATALRHAYEPAKVGMLLAGLEVPHVHIHLVPIDSERDLDFSKADPSPDPAELDAAAQIIRSALDTLDALDAR